MRKTIGLFGNGARPFGAALLASTIFTPVALAQDALPTGGQVVSGSATIETSGQSMEVNQSSDTLIANWRTFSIGENNSVVFNQPDAQSVALNRVLGQDPSQILGSLVANGKVFLINPNGIVIGQGGSVQAGGFVGSTLGISDEDFLGGDYRFTGSGGSIFNQGDLSGGIVALLAPRVTNEGAISGDTALAAGTDVTLDFDGDGLLTVEVSASTLATLAENSGLIQADGGLVILTARGANEAMKGVVNNTGVVEARSLEERDGRILLLGDMNNGVVQATGTLRAPFVETSAAQVDIDADLRVKTDGGNWLIDPLNIVLNEDIATSIEAALADGTDAVVTTILPSGDDFGTEDGTIFVDATVSWDQSSLTLRARKDIILNAPLFASGTAALALEFAQTDPDGDYYVNAPVNLASTGSFSTKKGADPAINYTVITSLGTEDSFGDGTLQGIRADTDENFVLGADIDATVTSEWVGENGNRGFDKLWNNYDSGGDEEFRGYFDGLGHRIENIFVYLPNERSGTGLFGRVVNSRIQNIKLDGGSINGRYLVGGIAGNLIRSEIRYSDASANVHDGGGYPWAGVIGGLVGSMTESSIINSYAEGDVKGNSLRSGEAGGLVGQVQNNSEIRNSYSTGDVIGVDSVGGLVGIISDSVVSNSYATGDVYAYRLAGGLIGSSTSTEVRHSFAAGDLFTRDNDSSIDAEEFGGLVGNVSNSYISNVYAVGLVFGSENGDIGSYASSGGLVGAIDDRYADLEDSTIEDSFWDVETTGQLIACGSGTDKCSAIGLSTAEMKGPANFIAAGWDFDNVWAIDPDINDGYPYLRATVRPEVVAPPSPPPPPPPPTTLTVDPIADFSADEAPYQPTIALSGSGFEDVIEVIFTWTDPEGQTGTVTWNETNDFGDGRFVASSDTEATIAPVLVAAGDPAGTYQWTVTVKTAEQSVSQDFAVAYTEVVAPPPPPPPPPPVELTLDSLADLSASEAPYQPTIALSGSGFAEVTEIVFEYVDPNGTTGTAVWNDEDFRAGRFVASSDTEATIAPVLVAANDPAGDYQWSVTLKAGEQTVTQNFSVTYAGVVEPPPPPPPPPPPEAEPLSLTSQFEANYFTNLSPYQQAFTITGEGFDGVTEVAFSFTDPVGNSGTIIWNETNGRLDSRFNPSSDGTSATFAPVLLAPEDPLGLYQWSVSISNGRETLTREFTVTYAQGPIQQEPVLNVEPDAADAPRGTVWGVVTDDEEPGLIDVDVADENAFSPVITTLLSATPEQISAAEELWVYAALDNNIYGGDLIDLPKGWAKVGDSNSMFGDLSYRVDTNAQSTDAYLPPNERGFYAETYIRTEEGQIVEVVMVFRGTEDIDDWIWGNILSAQERITRQYAENQRGMYPNAIFTSTGHSLGGALAKIASDEAGGNAIVFNTSPRGPDTENVTTIQEFGDPLNPLRGSDVVYNFSAGNARSEHNMYNLAKGMRDLTKD